VYLCSNQKSKTSPTKKTSDASFSINASQEIILFSLSFSSSVEKLPRWKSEAKYILELFFMA
tara:strand:+ start:696 stop:881 length:186 start_codon:yes stop_codon:yes gene_type:complete